MLKFCLVRRRLLSCKKLYGRVMEWTIEHIKNMANSPAAFKRAQDLVNKGKWQSLSISQNGRALWGECKGSGRNPYKTEIDLNNGGAFRCTCPSREHPCKHALSLLYIYVDRQEKLNKQTIEGTLQDWLKKRDDKQTAKEQKVEKTPEEIAKSQAAKAKRWEKRLALMSSGIETFYLWLVDLIRQGLINVPSTDWRFWERIAAQLTDAKMPALSLSIRELATHIVQSGGDLSGQHAKIAAKYIGKWNAMIQAFRKREQLTALEQEDLYSALGRNIQKKELSEIGTTYNDKWVVLGRRDDEDVEGRAYRQIWLWGIQQQQYGCVVDFSFGGQPYEQQFFIGQILDGALTYYPSNYPQRAIIPQFNSIGLTHDAPNYSMHTSIESAMNAYTEAIAQQPWLYEFPIVMENMLPIVDEDKSFMGLMDSDQKIMPLGNTIDKSIWQMIGLSGGNPITVFGTWDGQRYDVLSVIQDSTTILKINH